ncbi:pyruvate:ferredoxin (flavodoxin) oxidoreductase [Niallia circulans]|uniref:pyruvate:ferredoxin (flavodoxin) oxidoreductase n=1 Tax=Niallia circulans TaxID=1397 RepID=UPI000BA759E0|nr:pyruvate:ferredoxin (flavodoxin) oxidoreductase [Niallia circulans]PAD88052.1 pyruvate:ferredoxin (flavodoxin) oxidoreductase [Niallia circulans]
MRKVVDGNEAVAYISYAFTEAAVVYPITPSSTMPEKVEEWSQLGQLNIFGQPVQTINMQSESAVAGAMHGLLKAGALTTSYTSSQGLLLMEPTIYKLVGELLPGVVHVATRSLSSSALSIFGDHTDVMAIRQTGVIMLSSTNVQEAAYFAAVAHIVAITTKLPVIHFFEGFDTSHEMQAITLPAYQELLPFMNKKEYDSFKKTAIRNDQPRAYGSSQTPDIFFQQLEVNNHLYLEIPKIIQHTLQQLAAVFNHECSLVDFNGAPDAEIVIILMGAVSETCKQVVEEQNRLGKKYAVITIHLYRPFPTQAFIQHIPKTVRKLIVLDRTKENGSVAEPLLLDVQSACYELEERPEIIGGRYSLGSKEVLPSHIRAVFREAEQKQPKKRFTIGIKDDITNLSINPVGANDLTEQNVYQVKNWGMGSDGAVSCSRQTVKIIGEQLGKYVQGKFWFDPRKSGNLTVSHLRFSDHKINSRYRIQTTDFVSCYCDRYFKRYPVLKGLKANGILLINTPTKQRLDVILPNNAKKYLAAHNIQVYIISANKIARGLGIGPHINTIMQACFFYLSQVMEYEKAIAYLIEETRKKFQKVDPEMVFLNQQAMEQAVKNLQRIDVPQEWEYLEEDKQAATEESTFFADIQEPMLTQRGDDISVSKLIKHGMNDGSLPLGTTAVEKRNIATEIPIWKADKCIQCNLCSVHCPHAAIRPFLVDSADGIQTIKTKENQHFRIQVSPLDCTGCSICHDVCPVPEKALVMEDLEKHSKEADNWRYLIENNQNETYTRKPLLRDTQWKKPLLEFSGACAGCGQTAYVKLLTQLFGNHLVIANATGCSSIWSNSTPSVAFATDENGDGPVWGNSLLENNAEYGYGMHVGAQLIQRNLFKKITELMRNPKYSSAFRETLQSWCQLYSAGENNKDMANKLIRAILIEKQSNPELEELFSYKHFFQRRSQWIIGGDGWAYDIGYSGIDQLLSQGENINILILDNEGYSNTGGQPSKASPMAARMKFASYGKKTNKKNLAMLALQYENVYAAQVSLGANPTHTYKVFKEAEKHEGPSIIVAYSPCVLHGIHQNSSILEERKAVESGYWHLFRYQPNGKGIGKPKMMLDSIPPKWDEYQNFLMGEKRYSSLSFQDEQEAKRLLMQNQQYAMRQYDMLVQLEERTK